MKTMTTAALVLMALAGPAAEAGNACRPTRLSPAARTTTSFYTPTTRCSVACRSPHTTQWRMQRCWVPGAWVTTRAPCGGLQRMWQPGHWVSRRVQTGPATACTAHSSTTTYRMVSSCTPRRAPSRGW